MNYKFDGSKVFFTSDTHFYHGNVIRFLAPLVITDEQLKAGLDIFEKAVADCL